MRHYQQSPVSLRRRAEIKQEIERLQRELEELV